MSCDSDARVRQHDHTLPCGQIDGDHAREAAVCPLCQTMVRDSPMMCHASPMRSDPDSPSTRGASASMKAGASGDVAGSMAAFRYFAMSAGVERNPPAPANASSCHGGTAASLASWPVARRACCEGVSASVVSAIASGSSIRSRNTFA